MGSKQPYLNGAYDEPPIPPPTETNRRYDTPGFRRCIDSCILSLIAILIILVIIVYPLWPIFRPNGAKFYVTDANVNRFSLDPNSLNLHYSLDLNFTIRNFNQRTGVYYDEFLVDGYYGDQRFGSGNVSSFYQGHKNTTVIGTRIDGQNFVLLGYGARAHLEEDEKCRIYRIDAKLRLSMRFNYWLIKSWKLKPKIKCDGLMIPLASSNSTRGFKFQPVPCVFRFGEALFS